MLLSKAFARKILATSPLVAGAALLALAAFTPSTATAAPTLTIYHNFVPPNAGTDPSINPFNSSHTIAGQLSGVCAETSPEIDSDGEGSPCLVNSDCADFLVDEFCDLSGNSGVPVALHITGTNAQDTPFTSTDVSGQVSITYSDANGPGSDTIQGCADVGGESISATGCLTDSEPLDDFPSNTLTKDWIPTVVLSPPGAFNLTGGSHTVTATLNGVLGVCNGGIPTACTSDIACLGDGACDFSGHSLGIKVTSGPNLGGLHTDTGLVSTDSKGQVTMLYSDLGGPGTDFIQACADLFNDGDFDLSACLTDAAAGGGDSPFDDIASNVSRKVWSAQIAKLTPAVAFNPIGVQHQLTTTLSGFANICSDGTKTCSTNTDCTLPATCGQAGYPVFFAVVGTCTGGNNGGAICTSNSNCNSNVCTGGPNLGELGSSTTNSGQDPGMRRRRYRGRRIAG
jgi:hypothetical protein